MTKFTPSDLRAAADGEDDPARATMLRQGADAMERVLELERLNGRLVHNARMQGILDQVTEPQSSRRRAEKKLAKRIGNQREELRAALKRAEAAEARLAALTEKQE